MPRKTRGKTSAKIVRAARALRQESTPAEAILWQSLRGRRLNGLKFRRQHPFGPFVLDFFCVQHQFAIELDGGIHAKSEQAEHDRNRTKYLAEHGIRVLRFKNEIIATNLAAVHQTIINSTSSPSLSWNEFQKGAGGWVRQTQGAIMKILFIGGTGIISSACTQMAAARGHDLYLLNRGTTTKRGPLPEGVKVLKGDIRDQASIQAALGDHQFDAVVDWIAFIPEHIQLDLEVFRGRTRQFVFISSASAYQTPPAGLPVTESTVLDNPEWAYSRNKIACEEMLVRAYRAEKFPITIVRPSHTYDKTLLPFDGGYTVVHRMRQGKPVIVIGDGTSLWTLTHHQDFAHAFLGLLGNPHAIGESFHITGDEWLSWNQIYRLVADAAGVPAPKLVHIPSELIAAYDPDWGAGLLGDKSHSMIFDNSKIKRVVPDYMARIPFSQGAREIMAWYDADPARQEVTPELDALMDKIIANYQKAWPTD